MHIFDNFVRNLIKNFKWSYSDFTIYVLYTAMVLKNLNNKDLQEIPMRLKFLSDTLDLYE
jgi:hypothetical protein